MFLFTTLLHPFFISFFLLNSLNVIVSLVIEYMMTIYSVTIGTL